MALSVTILVIVAVVIVIWLILAAKRLKHKIWAIFLILLIIFTYVSFSIVLKDRKDVNLGTVSGMVTAGKLYSSWIVGVFHNIKSVTSFASKQDWKNVNESNLNKTKNQSIIK